METGRGSLRKKPLSLSKRIISRTEQEPEGQNQGLSQGRKKSQVCDLRGGTSTQAVTPCPFPIQTSCSSSPALPSQTPARSV